MNSVLKLILISITKQITRTWRWNVELKDFGFFSTPAIRCRTKKGHVLKFRWDKNAPLSAEFGNKWFSGGCVATPVYGAGGSGKTSWNLLRFEFYHIRGGNKSFSGSCTARPWYAAVGSVDPSRIFFRLRDLTYSRFVFWKKNTKFKTTMVI